MSQQKLTLGVGERLPRLNTSGKSGSALERIPKPPTFSTLCLSCCRLIEMASPLRPVRHRKSRVQSFSERKLLLWLILSFHDHSVNHGTCICNASAPEFRKDEHIGQKAWFDPSDPSLTMPMYEGYQVPDS